MKLRTKFALVLVAVMLVLSGVVLGSIQLFQQNTRQQERADIAETANLTALQIERNLNGKLNTVSAYGFREGIANYSRTTPLLQQFVNSSDFRSAIVTAPNGTVVDFWGAAVRPEQRQSRIGQNVSGSDYFQRSTTGELNIELLGPEQVAGRNATVLVFSAPVGGAPPQGESAGVFAATLFVDTTPTEGETTAFTFPSVAPQERGSQTVTVVGHTVDDEPVVVDRARTSFENSLQATSRVTYSPINDWEVTVIRDRSGLQSRIQRLQLIQGIGLLLVLGSILGMGYWEYTTNLTQTERLLEAFDALQSGDFGYSLSLSGAEEWRRISDGFDEMSTGLRERERGIREREQRLGVLNRVLRHNLQNDMSVILTYAEMLPELGGAEQDDAVDTILSKGRGLVAHGKKARQIEEAMESAEKGLVEQDLAALVEDALADLESEYPDATVENDLPEEVQVAGITSIRDAIESICENALEHNDADEPWMRASVDRDDEFVHLRVEDNGPGVPEYEQQVVSDAEETDLEHGSGLGLFLATWVVEKSNGEIGFETPEGGGTTVTLSFPTADAAGQEASATVTV